jgi:hypothetical protein
VAAFHERDEVFAVRWPIGLDAERLRARTNVKTSSRRSAAQTARELVRVASADRDALERAVVADRE